MVVEGCGGRCECLVELNRKAAGASTQGVEGASDPGCINSWENLLDPVSPFKPVRE